jgi:uncharacterized protein
MSQSYLDVARQGRNSWWRYLLGIFLILFLWLVVGSIVSLIVGSIFLTIHLTQMGLDSEALQQQFQQQLLVFLKTPSLGAYVTVNIPFIFFGLAILLVTKGLHQRSVRTLINGDNYINFKRLFRGFFVWFLISTILIPVDYFLNSQNYVFSFNPVQWFLLLPLALVLTPLQTSAEEFFFRGYLLQGLGLLTRQRFVLIIVSSLLFAVPHFANPEMQRGAVWLALLYFAFGVFLTVITLKDNRLELALGVHAANNLRFLFISTKDSALPAPAIWIVNDPGDPRLDLVFFLIQSAIFYYVFFGRQKSNV